MNKKGVELSVNFIVVVILCLVAMGFGIRFVADMIGKGNEFVKLQLSPNVEKELDYLLENDPVAIFPNSPQASRGKQSQFGVGIMNIVDETSFRLNISVKAGYTSENDEIKYDLSKFSFDYFNTTTIAKGVSYKGAVVVSVPKDAPSGQYIINVYACSGNTTPLQCSAANAYDSVEKVYLVVK